MDNSLHVGSYVDDVLASLDKERSDAVSVFRYGELATIGATRVDGVEGSVLLRAFVDNWRAPAVISRKRRPPVEYTAWELRDRLGNIVVVYVRGNVVYLVQARDEAIVEAVLIELCCSSA